MSSLHSYRGLAAAGLLLLGVSCNRAPPAVPAATGQSVSGNGVTLTAASIDLPFDDGALPEAPGADAVRTNCTACHSAAMILSQPSLTRAQWEAEIEKMQKAYKAPVDPAAVPAILGYLTRRSAG